MNRHFFHSYLAIICWVPIPLASKSIITQDFFVLAVSLLSGFCCYSLIYTHPAKIPTAFRKAIPVYILFAINLFWLLLQTLPLPIHWIAELSPQRVPFSGFEIDPKTLSLSFYPWATRHELLLTAAYLQLFALTLLLVSNKNRLRTLLYVLVALGLFQAAYGSIMTLSGLELTLWYHKEAHIGVATGTLLNRNHLANYLAFCAAAGVGLLLATAKTEAAQSRRDLARNLITWLLSTKGYLRFALVIMVTGLILTHSRMGNTAFFISLTAAGFIWLVLTRKISRTTLILFGSLLIIDALLMGSWFGIDEVAERIEATEANKELRNIMLPYMLTMANDFWIAGSGAGTFADIFPLYNQQMLSVLYNEAHSDYLQFLIEQGVIGIAPLALIILLSLFKTLQTLYRSQSKLLTGTGFSILMALIATGMHASVEYTLQRPATASLLVIFLALPWITAHLESTHTHPAKRAASLNPA